MNDIFKALNDATRREILELLKEKDLSAGEIADAFNISNSFIANPPSTASPLSGAVPAFENLNGPSQFGLINAAQPTRKMQFALKYTF